ncbi:MAG: amidohydrolase family protein [Proteobacteria bacterium]|nr:amidohydrolase family protein [Pseudomonadota bacterium]MDA1057432.1 amidohydrolase family protein [Pseudomonadota bacterium]
MTVASAPSGQYIIEAGWVLAYNAGASHLLAGGSVRIEDDRIAEISAGRMPGDLPRISVPGQLLMPGLISGHTHVASGTPTRGIIEGGRSFSRPIKLMDRLSDEELDDLTAFNLAEILKAGCTTQVEMSLSLRQAESYARVAGVWGARGFPGGMIPGTSRLDAIWFRDDDQALFDSVPDTLAEIEANFEFGQKLMGDFDGRLMPMMAPHATDTHTDETMSAIIAAANTLGTGIQIHLSQRETETEAVRKLQNGLSPTQWLDKLGGFEGPFLGAHMKALDWSTDPAILKRHGAVFAHCPSAGGAGGATQPYPEALAAGIATNIAIDTHSNDLIENIKLAVLGGRVRARLLDGPAVKLPTIWDAVDGATVVAADGLRRPDLGRICAGAKADFITVDLSDWLVGAGTLPPEPLNNLLYANGGMVRHVAVDGRFLVYDRQLTTANEGDVFERGAVVHRKLWKQLSDEQWFTPTPR